MSLPKQIYGQIGGGRVRRTAGSVARLAPARQLFDFSKGKTDPRTLDDSNITHNMIVGLKKALPKTNPQLIGDVVAHLSSMWDAGQKLDKNLRTLGELRSPQDLANLKDVLLDIEVIQLDYVRFWTSLLKKTIPRLRKAAEREAERQQRITKSKDSHSFKKIGRRRNP
jgi:hypothetical protein